MNSYKFSTVKIIPDLARNEPVNIGVMLHDVDDNRIYRRFTNNWAEFKRRTGIEYLPHTDEPVVTKDEGYLDALASETGKDSLEVTKPKPVSPIKPPQEMLDTLFESQISLPEKRQDKTDTLRRFRSSLHDAVRKTFPKQSYARNYAFKATVADRKFAYAFLRDKVPHLCIDCLSFSNDNVLDKAKIVSLDIGLIRSSQRKSGGPKTSFKIFSAQGKGEVETTESRVRKSLKVLELSKIPVVYKDQQSHELDQIRKKITHA